ncbi:MAG: TatD family hydrolase [Candidatus Neomarinimicrobiota bacterium]|nr:TatD family hydrolase [Candidatus Neomarinimicrobiota bacterium]MEE3196295.1 TatD family hydrolase [Candidatus Neomarinimicrobiota bacterium]|tara:strand:+ start:5619 stop:6374 length:756 start_codon:yes stop_codon:yes gene_type:complete
MLTDSHCHLFYDEILQDIDNVFVRSKKLGVNRFICVGTNINDSLLSLDISKKFENVFCSAGVHPHDSQNVDKDYIQQIELMMKSKKMIAIGEIGLDYFRNISSKKIQIKVFHELLQLANNIKKPIIFHNRDADKDIIDTLSCYPNVIGVSHCFSSTLSTAKKLLDMGYYISFSGNLTFKNSTLPSVAKYLPLNRLLVETDSPYLSPEPFRGKSNEPGRTRYVAEKLAEIHNISFESIANQTTKNINKLFSI